MLDTGKHLKQGLGLMLALFLGGCSSLNSSGNSGQVQSYSYPVIEAEWIRNAEPIEFAGSKWYPVNDYEVLDDSEVFQVGEYKDVQLFVAKIATRPYDRIFTKFDKGKFRYWERRDSDD